MATYTPEQAFKVALGYYNEAVDLIKEMTVITQKTFPKFSFDIALIEFEQILQCILLKVALSDGQFASVESAFIDTITQKGDAIKLANIRMEKETGRNPGMTWKNVLEFDNETLEKLSAILEHVCQDRADEFVKFFAKADAITETNYVKELADKVIMIVTALAVVDGDDIESSYVKTEHSVGVEMINRMFYERWIKALESEGNGGSSLKDNYLKKN